MDTGDIVKLAIDELPEAAKLVMAAIDIFKQSQSNNAEERAQAEATAKAMNAAAVDARHQTAASHAERTTQTEKVIDAAEHPLQLAPPDFDTSDVSKR